MFKGHMEAYLKLRVELCFRKNLQCQPVRDLHQLFNPGVEETKMTQAAQQQDMLT